MNDGSSPIPGPHAPAEPGTTDFGFRTVPTAEKETLVGEVFRSVAPRYDLMNDVLSLGVHRRWKQATVHLSGARPGHMILDLAGGTGDLSMLYAGRVGPSGHVVLADLNPAMLSVARRRIEAAGLSDHVDCVEANAEALPFRPDTFHSVTIGFGLRNVTRKVEALQQCLRVLRPGGSLLVLEFSRPPRPVLREAFHAWTAHVVPRLGRWVTGDEASYRYLAESIRVHPDQRTLLAMMERAGFEGCRFHNLSGGVVAVHVGHKT